MPTIVYTLRKICKIRTQSYINLIHFMYFSFNLFTGVLLFWIVYTINGKCQVMSWQCLFCYFTYLLTAYRVTTYSYATYNILVIPSKFYTKNSLECITWPQNKWLNHYIKDTYENEKKATKKKLVSQRSKMKIFIQITVGIVYQGDRRLPWLRWRWRSIMQSLTAGGPRTSAKRNAGNIINRCWIDLPQLQALHKVWLQLVKTRPKGKLLFKSYMHPPLYKRLHCFPHHQQR